MSTPFDLMTPAKSGFFGLVADKSLDKKRRGEAMGGAAIVFGPANTGRANFEISTPSDPANGLILMSDPARMAPRGSAGSWTFAVPVVATPTGWRPLETAVDEDKDFLTVKAKVLGSGKGVLINTTGHANGEPVVLLSSPLVAHHRGLTPPVQSAEVFDVNAKGELDGNVHGKLHYALYLTPFPRAFCSALPPGIPGGTVLPQYQSGPVTGPATHYAPILNFTRNGDGTPSYGPLHFENSEACASDEVNGPLCPAVDTVAANHRLASTVGGKPVYSAGIDLSRALFGLPSGKNLAGVWFETALTGTLFSPLDFNPSPYHAGTIGTYFRPVELREDFKAFHFNGCGIKVPGTKKWLTTADKQNYPALPHPSPLPIGYGKGPETGGGGSGGGGGGGGDGGASSNFAIARGREAATRAALTRPITGVHPTLTGPHEEEFPGWRGAVRPNAIDPPTGTGFPDGTTESWRGAFGFDEYDFLTTPRGPHHVMLPQYLGTAPVLTTGALRWPTQFDVAPSMRAGPDGRWYGERGYGKTSEVIMPGALEAHMAYKARHGELLPSAYTPSASVVLLNYKTASSAKIVETVFGLGCLHPQSNKPASGWLTKLDYTDSTVTPNLNIVSTDENGLEDAGAAGQVVKINGVAISAGSGDVVGPAGATADSLPMYDLATGKLIKNGKLMMGTSSIGAGVTPDTQTLKPVPAASHGVILILEGQPAVGANTDGAGISLRAGAKTGAGADGTGELFTAGAAVVVNIAQASVNTDVKGTLSSLANTATVAAVGTAVRLHGQDATTGPWEKVIPFELTTDGTTGLQTIIDIAEIANSTVTITYEANAIRSDAGRSDAVAGWASFSQDGGSLVLLADTQPHNTAGGFCDNIDWVVSGTNMRLQVTPGEAQVYRIRGFARVSHGTSGA